MEEEREEERKCCVTRRKRNEWETNKCGLGDKGEEKVCVRERFDKNCKKIRKE